LSERQHLPWKPSKPELEIDQVRDVVQPSLNSIDWGVIVFYAIIVAAIALHQSRKVKNQDDIFLAGRSMSRWPVAISMYMALFSTNTFIATVGWVNRPTGTIWILLIIVGMMLAVPLAVFLFPALFFRLRISTAYEYLEKRFSYPVRGFAATFFMAARIMWMSTMLYAASLVISNMLGWTAQRGFEYGPVWSILLLGSLGVVFAMSGGMRAVIWTDVVQFFVMMTGVVTMISLVLIETGGPGQVITIAARAGRFRLPEFFSLTDDLSVVSVLLFAFVGLIANAGVDQVYLQTYLTGKNEREVKASIWRNGFVMKPFGILFSLLGLLTFVYFQTHPEVSRLLTIPDDALPIFVTAVLPSGIRGLMIAALMSALLTSLEGGMAALSATLQIDFIRRWEKRSRSPRSAVLLGRILICAWGVVVMLGALAVRMLGEKNNIIQILNIVMYPFVGVLLGIFLLAILSHRANSGGTIIGAAAGFIATVSFPLSKTVLRMLLDHGLTFPPGLIEKVDYLASISNFFYINLGLVMTFVVGYAASWLFAPPHPSQIIGLTRRSMPKPV
jgi:SSS family transporter